MQIRALAQRLAIWTPVFAGVSGKGGELSEQFVPRLTLGLIALLALQVAALALDAAFPPDLSRAERASPVALDRNGAWLRALPIEHGRWRVRADLERTDPLFVQRLAAVEDAHYWLHSGVDPLAVARAAGVALVTGHVRSGASTLTMQTARLLEPRKRTFGAKLIQAIRALQLEARYSKRRILALYLTLAPYGGNLEGVRAASLAYFGHEPASLTDGEQALLIALPQSPEARRPDRHPAAAKAARARVLAKLQRMGRLSDEAVQDGSAEPLPKRGAFPSLAWHAAGEAAHLARSGQASVTTTLDVALQARLQKLATETAKAQGDQAGAAIMVVQIEGRAIRALVGSAGLERPGGWIDLTRQLRSPGSALKPFIYAFAFDQGVAAPDTLIQDAPRRFSDYQPENFDRVFHGPVTVREALTHSLNVPAVATLDRLGPQQFEAKLIAAGAHLVRPKTGLRDPGLALALGGEGISLRDLTMLYAALGDGGSAKPLALTEADSKRVAATAGQRLVHAEAANSVLDILRETPAPDGRAPAALTRGGPRLAFKTGTSYGFRDALAVGVSGGYVVAVWTGRPDGGARAGLTGRDASLPLLFDAVDAIDPPTAAPHPIAPRRAPTALTNLDKAVTGPHLIFPPNGAVVQVETLGPKARGLVLAAEGDGLNWYVDGTPLAADPVSRRTIWKPDAPGFYRVSVVDGEGREAKATVRVRAGK